MLCKKKTGKKEVMLREKLIPNTKRRDHSEGANSLNFLTRNYTYAQVLYTHAHSFSHAHEYNIHERSFAVVFLLRSAAQSRKFEKELIPRTMIMRHVIILIIIIIINSNQ